jgi:Tfp pilus assembly protein PilX
LLDISTLVFVLSIMVVGALLTATIRRDLDHRRRLRRDLQRQTERLRARRRQAERH